ncbi:MAG: restriction endonuclease [Elusimicrobiaceae bacterium]|nr:restriction endonuclease [Elusimicrobiaceae bacterium]
MGILIATDLVVTSFRRKRETISFLTSQNEALLKKVHSINEENKHLHVRNNQLSKISGENEIIYKKLTENFAEGLNYISELASDYQTLRYEIAAKYVETKKHPAPKEAERIRNLRSETQSYIREMKIMKYKYEYLFKLFPDLELYVDNLATIKEMGEFNDLVELEENVDRTRHYLTTEEWDKLSVDDRNQLALDRYIAGRKNLWEIGRDYEMFIGHEYEKNGWDIEYIGIEQKLKDLGRDIIAKKDGITLIIQCKYWAEYKQIHEKHIAQLYGTTVEYILSSKSSDFVVPVLITNIKVSDEARSFAKYLKVDIIESKKLEPFPRIKCNINKDEDGRETRIYHLPMDQKYDYTKISKPGEFFSFTVKEAASKGFRRAFRWYGNG